MFAQLFKRTRTRSLQVKLGGAYKNAIGDTVIVDHTIDPFSRFGMMGYDYMDSNGDVYRADGKFCVSGGFTSKDLVEELH